jgi:uncharacterized protein (DUF305 family)
MKPKVMKSKTPLLAIAFTGSMILAACSNSPAGSSANTQPASPSPNVAQSPTGSMGGMGNGSMNQSPGVSMPGMNQGSMNMSLGPKDENFDLRFIDGMTQLAQAIIDAQQKEIAQMREWRTAWYPNASATPMMYSSEMGHMMPMSEEMKSNMMMNMDLGAADDQFDLRFINAMLPHHEGAVTMAKEALQKSDRPEIKELAQNIITSQQQEIAQMQQWKKAWYGK